MLKSRNQITGMIHFMLPVILTMMVTVGLPSPAFTAGEGVSQNEATQFIREASHATEEAWEEFHTSAIEGTLASPTIQVTIEGQLHKARALLMQARIAKRSQDYQSVKEITEKILKITQNIIQASRERKQ